MAAGRINNSTLRHTKKYFLGTHRHEYPGKIPGNTPTSERCEKGI
jgi:hypothetical protein